MGYGWFDPTMILLLIGMALSMLASAKVQSTFAAYSRVRSKTGMTGAQAAERILRSQGIDYVRVGHVRGNLTDHYDPKNKVLNLSDTVYNSTSVSAIGVAAHECGHAVQDKVGYFLLNFRGSLVPAANFGAQLSWPLIIIGYLFGGAGGTLVKVGLLMFCAVVLFHLVTLPVELDASRRALRLLDENGILVEDEVKKTRKVLGAAALTYVAALAASILQLLRLLILFGGQRRNDD